MDDGISDGVTPVEQLIQEEKMAKIAHEAYQYFYGKGPKEQVRGRDFSHRGSGKTESCQLYDQSIVQEHRDQAKLAEFALRYSETVLLVGDDILDLEIGTMAHKAMEELMLTGMTMAVMGVDPATGIIGRGKAPDILIVDDLVEDLPKFVPISEYICDAGPLQPIEIGCISHCHLYPSPPLPEEPTGNWKQRNTHKFRNTYPKKGRKR